MVGDIRIGVYNSPVRRRYTFLLWSRYLELSQGIFQEIVKVTSVKV